jgi:predicted RNA-binding protein YlxR (DUF448 family)
LPATVQTNYQQPAELHMSYDRKQYTPGRTCMGCRTQRAQRDLLRLACTPTGILFVDHTGRMPGRGVYICWNVICLYKALKSAKLPTALKQSVVVPPFETMTQVIDKCLAERLRACVSLAHKARAAVSGYQAVRSALAQAHVLYMIFAEDIAAERAEEYSIWCTQYDIPSITFDTRRARPTSWEAQSKCYWLDSPSFSRSPCYETGHPGAMAHLTRRS